MVELRFTLSLEAITKLHDILVCLGKFSDTVSWEARAEGLTLSTLNLSKSGYASFSLSTGFFSLYDFVSDGGSSNSPFTCSLTNRALLVVFKARAHEYRSRGSSVDFCELELQENEDTTACRLTFRMVCSYGVTKSYQLTYEPTEVMHALFDKSSAADEWSIRACYLREYIEFFAPRAEQLDIYCDDGKVSFISFTEKIINSKSEILKHPLKTSVSVDLADFESFEATERTHLVISVKDFKAVVLHAASLNSTILANYSSPGKPLQFSYAEHGLICNFTLMTANSPSSNDVNNTAGSRSQSRASSRTVTRATSIAETGLTRQDANTSSMPPPAIVGSRARRAAGKLGQNESTSRLVSIVPQHDANGDDSLFVPLEDDDQRWDPPELENSAEVLGWDPHADNGIAPWPTIRSRESRFVATAEQNEDHEGLPPTQRISQVQGFW